jgi:hypothetical protein
MNHVPRRLRVRAFAVALAAMALSSCASMPLCSYLVLRLDDPIAVCYAGLDPDEPDLLAVDVVTGVVPRCLLRRQLAVPHGWEHAPTVARADGSLALAAPMVLPLHKGEASWRERLFQRRRIERWPAEQRAAQKLRLADDLPATEQRAYRVGVATTDEGARTFELFACSGDGDERMIATVTMPPELLPPELSFGTKAVVLPPLLAVDAVLVAGAVVCVPIAVPLAWLTSSPEPVDDSIVGAIDW